MNKPDKLNKFLVKELKSDLKDILILNTSDGGYIVFNKYTILEKQGLFEVKSTDSYAVFSSIKLALCYCVYHNIFELSSATRLKNLDEEIQYIKNNNHILREKIKTSVDDKKSIYLAKLQENNHRKAIKTIELNDLIIQSQMRQNKKFEKLISKKSLQN